MSSKIILLSNLKSNILKEEETKPDTEDTVEENLDSSNITTEVKLIDIMKFDEHFLNHHHHQPHNYLEENSRHT